MSKAFTKEDDAGGFLPPKAASASVPAGPFRVTATGAARLPEDVLARAEVLPPQTRPSRAALGVTVHVRTGDGEERSYRLVTSEEHALLGDGVSVASPLGRALLGAEVGDVRELLAPKGREELEVVALEGESM